MNKPHFMEDRPHSKLQRRFRSFLIVPLLLTMPGCVSSEQVASDDLHEEPVVQQAQGSQTDPVQSNGSSNPNEKTDVSDDKSTDDKSTDDKSTDDKSTDDKSTDDKSTAADSLNTPCATVDDCGEGLVCSTLKSQQPVCATGFARSRGPLGQVPPPLGLLEGSFRDLPSGSNK